MRAKSTYVLLYAFLTLTSPFSLLLAGVEIIASDQRGVTLKYIPEVIEANVTEGEVTVSLRNTDLQPTANSVLVPVRMITVAVPPDARPSIKLVHRTGGSILDGRLRPVTEAASLSDLSPAILSNDRTQIGDFERRSLSGYQTIRFPLYPLDIADSPPRVDIAGQMVVRVDFNTTVSRTASRPTPPNRMAGHIIANSEQAAGWGRSRTSNFTNTPEAAWPQGFIYNFTVSDEGIYKLSFEELKDKGITQLGSGIPSDQIRLFGNGGGEMPLDPHADVHLGLLECAIYVDDGGDNRFGPGDWLLFYGTGAGGWKQDSELGWQYKIHHYAQENVYWFNIDPAGGGARMESFHINQPASRSIDYGQVDEYMEEDRFIFGSSSFVGTGREWYGFTLDGPSQIAFNMNSTGIVRDLPASLIMRIVNAYGSSGNPEVELRIDNQSLFNFTPGTYSRASIQTVTDLETYLSDGYNTLVFEQFSTGSRVMVDWLHLKYHASLDRSLIFETVFPGEVTEYRITTPFEPWIFDISDHNHVGLERTTVFRTLVDADKSKRMMVAGSGEFKRVTSQFRAYFPEDDEYSIVNPWDESNRCDVILIVPDGYWEAIGPLIEHYGRRTPSLRAGGVRLSEVYNRFSGGVVDPAGIRNLLMYAQDYWADPPDYVVFCGDGDYNYRNIGRPSVPDQLPPYEMGTMCSDDWFVDFGGSLSNYPLPEMVHGRLPASGERGVYELKYMIDKIIAYVEEPEFGPWRNNVTFVADDEFGERYNGEIAHVRDSEALLANYIPAHYDRNKIYLTEYERKWGREKPEAGDDLVASINRGTLLVNYMGHGNPTLWAHEHVFVMSRDLSRIEPSRKQPLYIAFTCDWAYWDDPSGQSFPEKLLAMPDGGAISIVASTRLTFGGSNNSLARNFFGSLFATDTVSIGEALFYGKHQARGPNSATYHVLGDPSMNLGKPKLGGRFVTLDPYPLTPLILSNVAGEIQLNNNELNTDFSGKLEFITLDTEVPRLYLVSSVHLDGSVSYIPLRYNLPGPIIYRGELSVTDGQFEGQFFVPKDITLGGELGKVVGYFHNGGVDGVIARDSIAYANQVAPGTDDEPPRIKIYFDHRGFRAGDRMGPDPLLIVDLYDSSGLNLTGAMGHGITSTIDGGEIVDLTPTFKYDLDSFQSGSLEKQIGPLEAGLHYIEIQAWDSYNNLSVKTVEVEVSGSDGSFIIDHVLNWPNPFHDNTQLTFVSNRAASYELLIYSVGGRLVWDYQGRLTAAGVATDAIWDGHDRAGRQVGNGVYLYKVKAWDAQGNLAEGLGKIVYAR